MSGNVTVVSIIKRFRADSARSSKPLSDSTHEKAPAWCEEQFHSGAPFVVGESWQATWSDANVSGHHSLAALAFDERNEGRMTLMVCAMKKVKIESCITKRIEMCATPVCR